MKNHATNPRAVRLIRHNEARIAREAKLEERRLRHVEPLEDRGPGNLSDRLAAELRRLGLRGYHTRDSRRSTEGYPDWTIPTPQLVVFVEQKAAGGRLTYEQAAWLWALSGSGRFCLAAEGLEGLDITVRLLERLVRGDGLPSQVSASVGPWGTSQRMFDQLGQRPEIIGS